MENEQIKTPYEPAIHFQHVSCEMAGTSILEQITGSFPAGRITVLVGPSGAGKTTLLKMCNGLLSPTSGEITMQGRNIKELVPTDLRRQAGMVLQHSPMIAGSVHDNLALPLRLQGKSLGEDQALEILEQVGLEGKYLDHDSRNLSGGQQQKVSIARTLLNESKILLLDEITSALDPSSLNEVESLVQKLHEQHGLTVIWITHNLEQAKRMGEYAWIMVDGKLADAGEISVLDHSDIPSVNRFLKGDVS